MALPEITLPGSVSIFLAASQAAESISVYGQVPSATGHARRRRLRTQEQRVVSVASKRISQAAMTEFDDWYENVLLAGERAFSVQLSRRGPGEEWFAARWVEPPKTEALRGRWVVSGKLRLLGDEGSVVPPVDSGLSVGYRVALIGSTWITNDVSLSVGYSVALLPSTSLAVDYVIALVPSVIPIELEVDYAIAVVGSGVVTPPEDGGAGALVYQKGATWDHGGTLLALPLRAVRCLPCQASGSIVSAFADADAVGSATVEVWKDTLGGTAVKISGSSPITLSSQMESADLDTSDWDEAIVKGDILEFRVTAVSGLKTLTVGVEIA